MPTNFNLYSAIQDVALSVDGPTDTPLDISASLADSAPIQTIDIAFEPVTEVDTVVIWEVTFPGLAFPFIKFINCVYMENMDPSVLRAIGLNTPRLSVTGIDGNDNAYNILNVQEVDNKWYIPLNLPQGVKTLIVQLDFKAKQQSYIKLSPLFIGGDDLGVITDACYANDRLMTPFSQTEYQETLTQSYPVSNPDFPEKEITIPSVLNSKMQDTLNFLKNNKDKLTLFVDHEPAHGYDYTLGNLSVGTSSRRASTRNEINFNIRSKFST